MPTWYVGAKVILPALAIVGAGCWAFFPALHGGWIWDDYPYIVQNAALNSAVGLREIWLAPAGVNYFPVTFSVQWLQWQAWGDATTGYHLTNLALHLLNCFLLWRVLTRLGAVGCQVEVTDEGMGLPGTLAPALAGPAPADPAPELIPVAQLPESGRGLAVMRACVDDVTLDSRPGHGTVVTMSKHINWSSDAPVRRLRAAS